MKVKRLSLTNFRNYQNQSVAFSDGLVILTGENAQGKTNLLESIFFLALAKSHRAAKDSELIHWDQSFAQIQALVEKKHYELPLEVHLSPKGKTVKVNHIEQAKRSQFVGQLNVVLFAPEDMQLVKGSPALRRRFLDLEISQSHPIYVNELIAYNRILKQRNLYLKKFGHDPNFDSLYFDVMTDQLIEKAVELIKYRQNFVQQLEAIAQPLHHHLSNKKDQFQMTYVPSSSKLNYDDPSDLTGQYKQIFSNALAREKAQGYTVYGPHRDDLVFYINQKLAQDFASQGQQRTLILSLKLAEIELLYRLKGDYPILLLDDVLSELDDDRQHLLMSMIEGKVQTFLTTATIKGLALDQLQAPDIFFVKEGSLEKLTLNYDQHLFKEEEYDGTSL